LKSTIFCLILALSLCAEVSHSQQPAERLQVSSKSKPVGLKVTTAQRINFAKSFEKRLKARGDNAQVVTQGDANKTLVIKWSSLNRAFAREMADNAKMVTDLREMGFKRMLLMDGKKYAWDVDLKN
jgi:hypothetical protein